MGLDALPWRPRPLNLQRSGGAGRCHAQARSQRRMTGLGSCSAFLGPCGGAPS